MNNLNKREIVLIVILINLLGYYLLFNVITKPIVASTNDKKFYLEELKYQKEIQDIEASKMDTDLANLSNITSEIENIYNQLFSITNTENIHYFINKIAKLANVTVSFIKIEEEILTENVSETTTIETLTEETTNNLEENAQEPVQDLDSQTKLYNIELELIGDYENKIAFLKKLEELNKAITFTEVNFLGMEGETISKINLKLYAIKKETEDSEFKLK